MGRSVVLAVPGPDVFAIPDDVGLAIGAKHRQPCLVRGRIPHPQRMGSRNQGCEFRVVLSVRARNCWNAEIGALHDGAGEAVGSCLLEVDEELLGVLAGSLLSALAVAAIRPVPAMTSTKASGAIRRSAGLESKIRTCPLLPRLTVRSLWLMLRSLAPARVQSARSRSSAIAPGSRHFVQSPTKACGSLRPADTWRVRVLLVDDEERMVAALRRGLAAEGFVVESATDGKSGLQLAQHGDFDAVVLDVMLPGLSGYEVVRRLRAR